MNSMGIMKKTKFEVEVDQVLPVSEFQTDIYKFNEMYGLPINTVPSTNIGNDHIVTRLTNFKKILLEEIEEIEEVIELAEELNVVNEPDVLTALADLLGDIQVYCASEMQKFGLPIDDILSIIMNSNFSKMGADGKPIYDGRGKLRKGPDYWKPEPKIRELILELMKQK